MKILLVGKNGQIGWELRRTLATLGEIMGTGRKELDLKDLHAIRNTVRRIKPDLIVNAAAYTDVDCAEKDQDQAMAINALAPGVLAREAARCGAMIVHYSTDYVFDGISGKPYREDDEPRPLNIYGKSKLLGENAIKESGAKYLILRTSWIYGLRGRNFLLTIARLAQERGELSIVDDQTGSPTWCRLAAEATSQILAQCRIRKMANQTYHFQCGGETTWYGFARAIMDHLFAPGPAQVSIKPIASSDYQTPALRPAYSVLNNEKLWCDTGIALPHWNEALKMALESGAIAKEVYPYEH